MFLIPRVLSGFVALEDYLAVKRVGKPTENARSLHTCWKRQCTMHVADADVTFCFNSMWIVLLCMYMYL